MKTQTKEHLKKYGLDLVGGLLILIGAISLLSVFPGSTYLMLTGIALIVGKRGMKKIMRKYVPWLKKKHAEYKKKKVIK